MEELLWAAIALFAFIGAFSGKPFRKMQGNKSEIARLGGVYLLLLVAFLAEITVDGWSAHWRMDADTVGSIVFGFVVGAVWALRVCEWEAALRKG